MKYLFLLLTLTACASDGVDWNGMIQGFAELERWERQNPQYEQVPQLRSPQNCVPQFDGFGTYLGCF